MRSPSVTTMMATSEIGSILQDGVDLAAIRVDDEQAASATVDVAELLTGLAHGRRLNNQPTASMGGLRLV
jgi:hypothetical protein